MPELQALVQLVNCIRMALRGNQPSIAQLVQYMSDIVRTYDDDEDMRITLEALRQVIRAEQGDTALGKFDQQLKKRLSPSDRRRL